MAIWYGDAGSDNTNNSGGALTSSIQTSNSGIDTRWSVRNESAGTYGQMRHDASEGGYSSTAPTTSNGNFAFGTISGQVQAQGGFITPPITGTIPSGQWSFQIDIDISRTGGSTRFVGFLFKCDDETASSSGNLTATAIPMYSNASLNGQYISAPVSNTVNSTNGTITTYTITWYCDSVSLNNEHLYFQLWNEIVTATSQRVTLEYVSDPNNFNDVGVALITPDARRRVFVIS